ncbi:hypothetical protein [Desulfogranum marinum]|uniref:hypothetical protein n=1 Tax=Desulfogranum marinum TaxID=453220 RepID=UPI00196253C4|nr:hypothetical protein [Desulfogranum marinum]MBM9510899.1 hypothetical protein [Desulfogranum marinum]
MPKQNKENPSPQRVAFLRQLPLHVKETITGDEAHQFMFEEEIPESLYEKIKDYIEEENQ